jgi:hypothetical protein
MNEFFGFAQFLKFGPLGAAIILAILVFRLVYQLPSTTKSRIKLTWGFMAFALILAMSGFILERVAGVTLVQDKELNRIFMTGWGIGYAQAFADAGGNQGTAISTLQGVIENAARSPSLSKEVKNELAAVRQTDPARLTSAQLECIRLWMLSDLQGGESKHSEGECNRDK